MPPLILPRYLRPGRDDAIATASQALPSRVPVAQTAMRERGVNVFACPVCRKEFRQDDEFEPMCTGPNETQDDHPMTVMQLVRVEPRLRQW